MYIHKISNSLAKIWLATKRSLWGETFIFCNVYNKNNENGQI